ncbi:brachyurin-like isoform X2 [Zophobas morio]|uniref:brachyurin-like isoform X2 n=1 Tax=Zophobas morio TaxID=2755281 RepID=UPI0030836CDB
MTQHYFLFLCITVLVPFLETRQVPPNGGRIIGGTDARVGQFPSAAAIYATKADGTYFCGGTLTNPQFVLTAAHCVTSTLNCQVVLGSTTLQGSDPNRLILSTNSRVIHRDFNPETLENDIALLMFHVPIKLTDYIQPINLPTERDELFANTEVMAIGWGQTSDGLTNHLNYVTVSTLSNAECQISFGDAIINSMVCAVGNYNEGACIGDSGGPLIAEINNKQYVVDISSFISTRGAKVQIRLGIQGRRLITAGS